MFDRQAAFDTMLAHLRQQGRQALTNDGCAYRTPEGLKCAVGCLISDERYTPDLEDKTPTVREVMRAVDPTMSDPDAVFLRDAQRRLHDDRKTDLSDLEGAAEDFADKWELTYADLSDRTQAKAHQRGL